MVAVTPAAGTYQQGLGMASTDPNMTQNKWQLCTLVGVHLIRRSRAQIAVRDIYFSIWLAQKADIGDTREFWISRLATPKLYNKSTPHRIGRSERKTLTLGLLDHRPLSRFEGRSIAATQ